MELPEHIISKIMLYNSHPIADLLKEYKEEWYYDYRERYYTFPDEYFFSIPTMMLKTKMKSYGGLRL